MSLGIQNGLWTTQNGLCIPGWVSQNWTEPEAGGVSVF